MQELGRLRLEFAFSEKQGEEESIKVQVIHVYGMHGCRHLDSRAGANCEDDVHVDESDSHPTHWLLKPSSSGHVRQDRHSRLASAIHSAE